MAKPPAAGAQPFIETVAMSEDDEEDEGTNYYYYCLNKSGKQQLSTPNMMMMIQDQKYNIEHSSKAQTTVVVRRMEVNKNNLFHKRFINPYNKNQAWSATPIIMQNGTTGATRCLFEEAERNNNKPPQNKNKRSRDSYDEVDSSSSTSSIIGSISNKKTKSQAKMKMMDLIQRILAVQDANTTDVYDSCPEVIKKIKDFLRQDGITKEDFCQFCLGGGVNSNALNHFLASKKQDQAANQVYPRAYGFFEKKRILEGTPKSMLRLKNEYYCSSSQHGFAWTNPNTRQWVFVGDPW